MNKFIVYFFLVFQISHAGVLQNKRVYSAFLITQDKEIKEIKDVYSLDIDIEDDIIISKNYKNNNLKVYNSIKLGWSGTIYHDEYFEIIYNSSLETIEIFRTSPTAKARYEFNLLFTILTLKQFLGVDEIQDFFVAKSCIVKELDYNQKEKVKEYKFDKLLQANIKQIVINSDDHVFVFKLDLSKNKVNFYTKIEPIFRFTKGGFFSESVVHSLHLDDRKKFIENSKIEFTNSEIDIDEEIFSWKASSNEVIFSFDKKLSSLEFILEKL